MPGDGSPRVQVRGYRPSAEQLEPGAISPERERARPRIHSPHVVHYLGEVAIPIDFPLSFLELSRTDGLGVILRHCPRHTREPRKKLLQRRTAEVGQTPAFLAHQYALSMDGPSTIVLGVKNRDELRECVAAEAAGPMEPALMARIDAAVGRVD